MWSVVFNDAYTFCLRNNNDKTYLHDISSSNSLSGSSSCAAREYFTLDIVSEVSYVAITLDASSLIETQLSDITLAT